MSERKPLFPLFIYQRYLGITDLNYSRSLQRYVINPTWVTYIAQFIPLCIISGCFGEIIFNRRMDYLNIQSSVGYLFVYLLVISIPMSELMANIWLRIVEQTQQNLLNRLAAVTSRLRVDTTSMKRPQWIRRLWIGICLFYLCMLLNFLLGSSYSRKHIDSLFSYLSLYLLFVRTNYVISCYTTLVYLIRALLRAQENQWKGIWMGNRLTISRTELAISLNIYDELLRLCHEEIVQVFGITLIFPYLFFVLDAGSICFITTFNERFSIQEVILTISWMSPLILYMTMPLTINEVTEQVSEGFYQNGRRVKRHNFSRVREREHKSLPFL